MQLIDNEQLYEENKKLKEKISKLEKSFHYIDWELETLCEFLENKKLTDEAAEFIAKQFVKFVNENNNSNDNDNDKENVDYISA